MLGLSDWNCWVSLGQEALLLPGFAKFERDFDSAQIERNRPPDRKTNAIHMALEDAASCYPKRSNEELPQPSFKSMQRVVSHDYVSTTKLQLLIRCHFSSVRDTSRKILRIRVKPDGYMCTFKKIVFRARRTNDLTRKLEKVGPFECDKLEKHCRVGAKCYPTKVPVDCCFKAGLA